MPPSDLVIGDVDMVDPIRDHRWAEELYTEGLIHEGTVVAEHVAAGHAAEASSTSLPELGAVAFTAAANRTPNGAMVALVPNDLGGLALDPDVDGAEPPDVLHLTLAYHGDAADWDDTRRAALLVRMRGLAETRSGTVTGLVFGAAHWNVLNVDPSWVLNVGGPDLDAAHDGVWDVLRDGVTPELPEQHQPWVPHICLAYSREDLLTVMEQRVGREVTFSKLRVAFGNDVTDLPLLDAGPTEGDIAASGSYYPREATSAGETMPWEVRKGGGTCGSSKWAVIRVTDGHTEGCHDTEADARRQQAAKYAQEGDAAVTETLADRPPSEDVGADGCPPGKRKLGDNCVPDESYDADHAAEHLAFAEVDNTPWDAGAAMGACGDAACYRAICAGRRAGDPSERQTWALPHHKSPGAAPNAAGVRNALARFGATTGLTNAGAARSHLDAHMATIRNAAEAAGVDLETFISLGGDPNPGTPPDRRLHENKRKPKKAAAGDAPEVEVADDGRWEGVLTVEGRPTGDGRQFARGALRWTDLPLTLSYQPPSHGGVSTDGFVVGNIEWVERDGDLIRGGGRFDLGNTQAADIARQVGEGFLKGISVDVDDVKDADVELVFPERPVDDDGEEMPDGLMQLFGPPPELVIFHDARIRAASIVPIPAFIEASIRLVGEGDEGDTLTVGALGPHATATSDGTWDHDLHEARARKSGTLDEVRRAYAFVDLEEPRLALLHHELDEEGVVGPANLTACAAGLGLIHESGVPQDARRAIYEHLATHLRAAGREPPPFVDEALVAHGLLADDGWHPPAAWFRNPELSVPTGITIDDAGRVYGHAAQWGSCHVGYPGECVPPPREDGHPYFLTGEVLTADGTRVAVGQITVGTTHAALYLGAGAATDHYDHTGYAVADVAVGNDAHGIWVAGALREDADVAHVRALRASGQVSGDWRRIGGGLRLIGLLAVNVPGFPVPRAKGRAAYGSQLALVAAGRISVAPGGAEDLATRASIKMVVDRLAARVGVPPRVEPVDTGLVNQLADRVHRVPEEVS